MVRISDIAEDLGVSRSLVSKVLSGKMGQSTVRPELAERIRARARQLGYVPNMSAKSLFTGRQHAIGVFISRHGQPGSGLVEALIDGVSAELAKTQQRMILQFFHDEPDFEPCLAAAHRNLLDGVVVAGAPYFDLKPHLKTILGRGVPVATMFDTPVSPEIPNAGIDQTEVGYAATRHLVERGCRAPALVFISRPEVNLRYAGYCRALKEAGIPLRSERLCRLRTYEGAKLPDLVQALIASGEPFDGIVAESDRQSAIILRALLGAGVRVPRDVKLIGVDDAPVCEFSPVHLSSVSGQDRRRAALTVRLLQEVIEGKPPRHVLTPPTVSARESTAASDVGSVAPSTF
ncbi:MAG: LacI family DNA-binding transcriptional regulator [Kiritimatiellae bacterium]|nr:LacI family DNA-binding transcriptional regulator [Kiritimatiellia bacterium]